MLRESLPYIPWLFICSVSHTCMFKRVKIICVAQNIRLWSVLINHNVQINVNGFCEPNLSIHSSREKLGYNVSGESAYICYLSASTKGRRKKKNYCFNNAIDWTLIVMIDEAFDMRIEGEFFWK